MYYCMKTLSLLFKLIFCLGGAMLSLDSVYRAAFLLKDVIRKTDLIPATTFPQGELFFKTENLQITGSFKLRGAYYKISQLSEEQKDLGIVACSAGNHAQGVALAAQRENIPAIIYMPDGAPISKVEATKSYGVEVRLEGETYDDAFNAAVKYQQETGATFIHPFDDLDVIAGQGTIGLEILEQLPEVDQVIIPIGGGGLISGVSFVLKSLKPEIKIIGVQAARAASMLESVKEKERVELPYVDTFADGIAVKMPGENTFELCKNYVDEIITVTEDEVATAILTMLEKQKLICEGAGAVSVAAAIFGKVDLKNKSTVAILSGGNIDVNILSRVISRGLLTSGRIADFTIALTDKPGQLVRVSKIVAEKGANVIGVFHDQGETDMGITECFLRIKMETKDSNQIKEIKEAIKNDGFNILNI